MSTVDVPATRYTVLIYDRRGFSRSHLLGEQDYAHRLDTNADDVRRLIDHVGGPGTVFGASSGAIVALAVLARHPSVVDTLVPFEPPVMRLLPDGRQWIDFFTDLYDQYRRSGVEPALTRFRERAFPASDRQSGHRRGTRSHADWDGVYAGTPRWDIGRPQPAFHALADEGAIQGRVLDVGCGTGEHVLMAAQLGLDATGVDVAATALRAARRKARDRGLTARFLERDARELAGFGELFDTVLDCGLFQVFADHDRATYVSGVRSVLRSGGRYFMLCFSDQHTGARDPLRVSRHEITTAFAEGWRVDAVEPTTLDSRTDPDGVPAWLVALTRT